MKRIRLFVYGLLVCLPLARFVPADDAIQLIEARKIWDQAPHNAFTDLIRYSSHEGKTSIYLAKAKVTPVNSSDAAPSELAAQAIAAAGGSDKLLKLFRMKEKFNSGATLDPKGQTRESIVEPPGSWWLGKSERKKEPAKYVVWAWTLGALTDPNSKLESIPDVTDDEKLLAGIRVSGTIDPPMELYFSKSDHRLVRVDWRGDIYRFSDWKEHDGAKYPAKCVMFKQATGKPWFYHEILEVERLKELPPGLPR